MGERRGDVAACRAARARGRAPPQDDREDQDEEHPAEPAHGRRVGFPIVSAAGDSGHAGAGAAVGRAPRGTLRSTRPDEMGAAAIREALRRVPGLDVKEVEDVILGCAMPEAEQGFNVARVAAIRAGLPVTTSAMTVNRFCSSGLQAIALASEQIRCGSAEVIVAGGTDTHLMLVDVFSKGLTGKDAEQALERAAITVNKNAIPFDTNPPMKASGIRVGTPAVTTRGMKEPEMRKIGHWIA